MNSPFTNESIDLEQLPRYESVQLSKPHPSYWKVIAINISIFLIFLGIVLTVLLINVPEVRARLYLIVGAYILFGVLLFMIFRASFKKRGFALREKDMIYKSGIIAETTTIVPLNRIQHVALDEGIFSRIFKLGKLQIYTAGGQTGHLMVSGIEIEKAKSMKELLLRKLAQIDIQAQEQS
jgi:membrane protein YdbS with pleckstrin-like domain